MRKGDLENLYIYILKSREAVDIFRTHNEKRRYGKCNTGRAY